MDLNRHVLLDEAQHKQSKCTETLPHLSHVQSSLKDDPLVRDLWLWSSQFCFCSVRQFGCVPKFDECTHRSDAMHQVPEKKYEDIQEQNISQWKNEISWNESIL